MWLSTAIVSASGQRQRLGSDFGRPLGGKQIGIPTITSDGTQDPLKPGGRANHARFINRASIVLWTAATICHGKRP
jgi:hypothetical protein